MSGLTSKEWQKANPEKVAVYAKRSRLKHPEYYKEWRRNNPEKVAAYHREWIVNNPESYKASNRRSYLAHKDAQRFRRAGATADWFRDQLVGQAGFCAICGKLMEPGRGTHIDHDHVTMKPRGLLCNGCNIMLGLAYDSVKILQRAAAYIQES